MSSSLPRIAVIGAGSSGITALKTLAEQGFDVTCYEASDRIGGNWVYENSNGMSACYRDLHINTSRLKMEYSDHPMPESYPDYPRHDQIAAYFDDYVDHFGIRDRIRFETKVEHAGRAEDGTWTITASDGTVERYDALLVANGHHWNPRWPGPAFPGSDTFEGVQLHAHSYVDNTDRVGKDVVVLGIARQGRALGRWLPTVGARVTLSDTRPAEVLGKALDGLDGERVALALGGHPLALLDDCDVLCVRGGVPLPVPIVQQALRLGYRHIDTAQIYDNEREVGEGMRASGVKRNEVFLTTKVWTTHFSPNDLGRSAKEGLARLRMTEVDLLLLHWPNPQVPLAETLGALARVKQLGLARHIGVSNFTVALIDEAVEHVEQFGEVVEMEAGRGFIEQVAVSYTHLRAHETVLDLVCRLLLEKKKNDR